MNSVCFFCFFLPLCIEISKTQFQANPGVNCIYCISLQSSEVAQVRAKGKSLQLLLAVEALRNDLKRQKTAAEDSKPVGEESTYGT